MPRLFALLALLLVASPVSAGVFTDAGEVFLKDSVAMLLKDIDAYMWVGPVGNLTPSGAWRFNYKAPFAGAECPLAVTVFRWQPIAIEARAPESEDPAAWVERLDHQLRLSYRTPADTTFRGYPAKLWKAGEDYQVFRTDPPGGTVFWVCPTDSERMEAWGRLDPFLEVEDSAPQTGGRSKVVIRNTGDGPFSGRVPIAIRTFADRAMGERAFELYFALRSVSGVQGFQALADRTNVRQRFLSGIPTAKESGVVFTSALTIPAGETREATIAVPAGVVELEILNAAAAPPPP